MHDGAAAAERGPGSSRSRCKTEGDAIKCGPGNPQMRVMWPVCRLEVERNQHPGIMTMGAILKKEGFDVEVVPSDVSYLESRLADGTPTILAYSTPTPYYGHYKDVNRRLKQRFPSVISVFGGPHPTFFPEMIEDEGVDAVCIGEGEHAMAEFATGIASGSPVRELRNWWVKEEGVIHRNGLRPLIEDLDSLPLPDHELFRRAMPAEVNQAIVMTGRGCPASCTYCFNHGYRELYKGLGNPMRRRSVGNVIRELEQVKGIGYQFIRFMDDVFILREDWVSEFCDAYSSRIGLPFSCLVRADLVKPAIIGRLKKAGCFRIMMGIEAGNDRLRNEILKRNMPRQVIIDAARVIRAERIKLVTANILAIPGGSYECDLETVLLNIECRPNFASASILQPYPRTRMYQLAESEGLIDEGQMSRIESSLGFGLRSDLLFRDTREKARMENLHKFFPLAIWFPWLLPIFKLLTKLPPNRAFDFLYLFSANCGINLVEMPPRLGIPVFMRKAANSVRRRLGLKPRWSVHEKRPVAA